MHNLYRDAVYLVTQVLEHHLNSHHLNPHFQYSSGEDIFLISKCVGQEHFFKYA